MSAISDFVLHQEKICREHWFKSHQATFISELPGALVILWRNPDSWNYGCRFIIHSRWLCVVGDIGEAVYEWNCERNENLKLYFLAGCDFHYFHSKCQSSEHGRCFNDWDSSVGYKQAQKWLASADSTETDDHLELIRGLTDQSSKEDFREAAKTFNDSVGDSELASMISEFGSVPSRRCIGHWVGLKMAREQLRMRNAINADA
jgi:hypothetical protein